MTSNTKIQHGFGLLKDITLVRTDHRTDDQRDVVLTLVYHDNEHLADILTGDNEMFVVRPTDTFTARMMFALAEYNLEFNTPGKATTQAIAMIDSLSCLDDRVRDQAMADLGDWAHRLAKRQERAERLPAEKAQHEDPEPMDFTDFGFAPKMEAAMFHHLATDAEVKAIYEVSEWHIVDYALLVLIATDYTLQFKMPKPALCMISPFPKGKLADVPDRPITESLDQSRPLFGTPVRTNLHDEDW